MRWDAGEVGSAGRVMRTETVELDVFELAHWGFKGRRKEKRNDYDAEE